MDIRYNLIRSARSFLSGTMLCRVTGLLRDVVMAYSFGSQASVAALLMAFRFSNLLRRLFGEGAMHTAFVPYFEELKTSSSHEAACFYQSLTRLLFFLLLTLCLLSMLGLGSFLLWGELAPSSREVLWLTFLMLPVMIFVALSSLQTSFLQCAGKFFLPSLSPAVVNIVWIGVALCFRSWPMQRAMEGLAIGILLGFFVQWLVLVPMSTKGLRLLKKEGIKNRVDSFFPKLKRFLSFFGLGAIGVGAAQINTTLDALFARASSLEGPAYLWYAIRVQQLPLALFGIALAGALLPPLSRARENKAEFSRLLLFALRKGTAFSLPAASALLFLGLPIISLLFERGDFTELSLVETSKCLWGYAIGLPPMIMILIAASAFYAKKQYHYPVYSAVIALVVNTSLNALFVFALSWSSFSIALATSISAWINAIFLLYLLQKKEKISLLSWGKGFTRCAFSCCLAGAFSLLVGKLFCGNVSLELLSGAKPLFQQSTLLIKVMYFGLQAACFVLVLFTSSYLIKDRDTCSLLRLK